LTTNKIHIGMIAAGMLLIAATYTLSHCGRSAASETATPDSEQILGVLQSQTKIATTTVTLRKMAIYDSQTGVVSLNPATWRLGRRFCIVPVDITLKYGIDLADMTADDISPADSAGIVRIRLPKAHLLDSSFTPHTDRSEIVSFATGLRDHIGETTIQQIKTQTFADVVNKDEQIHQQVAEEIYINTKSVFRSLLQGMGLRVEFTNEPLPR
jgi:hypothetical protein